jgi:polyphosphate glucokinase
MRGALTRREVTMAARTNAVKRKSAKAATSSKRPGPTRTGGTVKRKRAPARTRAGRKKTNHNVPKVLVVDVGGSSIKFLCTGETEPRRIPSGPEMTPASMVDEIRKLTRDWKYDVVSIGCPGPVGVHGPRSEPGNLGGGWVGFDFAAALERPVRIINDAAMQALGSYEGGRMLFLGFGTGLGSTLIAENVIIPLELGKIVYDKDKSLGELLGRRGLKALGKASWRKIVAQVLESFTDAFMVDYIVIGGGNAKIVKDPPPGVRLGHNLTAFRGGMRLWTLEGIHTHSVGSTHAHVASPPREWCVL